MRCDYALYFIRVILCPSVYMSVISYTIYDYEYIYNKHFYSLINVYLLYTLSNNVILIIINILNYIQNDIVDIVFSQ